MALSLRKPIVTLPGEFMRGRHTKAFLEQAGMDYLIAGGAKEYIRLALDRGAQEEAVSRANFDGPFGDLNAVRALDAWLRSVCGLS